MFSYPLRTFGRVVLMFKADPKFPPTYSLPSLGPIFPASNPLSLLLGIYTLLDTLTSSSIEFTDLKKNFPEIIKLSDYEWYFDKFRVFPIDKSSEYIGSSCLNPILNPSVGWKFWSSLFKVNP